jgi:hypothetical protein
VKRLLRTLILFVCAIGLLSMAMFALGGTPLALPAGIAGVSSFLIALA